jgi:lipopolysaccharide transport system ATP-binding protein
MQVRLAFAVAAHLEPEILVVDEVLAVGDMEFQKKCIGQMDRVAKEGRTVLFVSHNMTAVANLCTRALCLSDGKIVDAGLPEIVISNYYNLGAETGGEVIWENMQTAPGNDKIRLHAVRIVVDGKATTNVDIQKDVEIQIEFWNLDQNAMVSSSIHLLDKMGTKVLASGNMTSACLNDDGWFGRPHPVGIYRTFCILPGNFLNEGLYRINVIVLTNTNQIQARIDEVVSFTVYDTGDMRKEYHGTWIGVVRPKLRWQTKLLDI